MYNKTTWSTGDTITAEKLNNMEDGIASGGGAFVITATTDYTGEVPVTTLNKTWNEIKTAIDGGQVAIIVESEETYTGCEFVVSVVRMDAYFVYAQSNDTRAYMTNSADGYPSYHEEE